MKIKLTNRQRRYYYIIEMPANNEFIYFIEDVLLMFADDDAYWGVADNLYFIGELN